MVDTLGWGPRRRPSCLGNRCLPWIREKSLCVWLCWREPTGGSCAGASGSVPRRATRAAAVQCRRRRRLCRPLAPAAVEPRADGRRDGAADPRCAGRAPGLGARKIAAVLARIGHAAPACSTVHQVLRRHGLVLPAPGGERASLRFEADAPNDLWQMDFKGHSRLGDGSRLHPLTESTTILAMCPASRRSVARRARR